MSYRCGMCGEHKEGAPKQIVLEERSKTYFNGERQTTGREIVKEAAVCSDCALKHSVEELRKKAKTAEFGSIG